jgi:ABC-type glycerol-3-phosphate transport system substrate-binding protein
MDLKSIDRRHFIKITGIAGILAARQAPAFAQGSTLHWVRWVDFIPESDVELKRQMPEAEKALGAKIQFETINANDLQPRITAAIQSGAGPDIIMMLHNWPHLYAGGLADIGDLCDWKATEQGGYYPHSDAAARLGKRWLALPYFTGAPLIAYRKSWFVEVGATQPPKTLEDYKKLGIALKKKGKPIGQTLGHTFGDAPAWTYPITWTFGGAETDPSGKKVVLNSKGAVEAVKWMTDFWKQACDESALAWDDTNNNRAFLSQTVSATNNGASIYIEAKKKPDTYKTEKGTPMWQDIQHARIPGGAGGQFNYSGPQTHLLMGYSKNLKPAKDFLRWMHSKPVFEEWFMSQQGYTCGATTAWETHKVWDIDPVLKPFHDLPRTGRLAGYAGPPDRRSAEVVSKYIIVDMYAKAIQGMAPEDSAKWAHGELAKVYV